MSVSVGLLGATLSCFFGVIAGLTAGYYGGLYEDLVMRFVDGMLSLPSLLVALFVLFILGGGFANLILVFAVLHWMVFARMSRGLALAARSKTYVVAAKAMGASGRRIVFRHILPNVVAPILVLYTLEIAILILSEASLSFLGFGVQPPDPSWGLMIADGREHIRSAWWLVAFPGLAIFLTRALSQSRRKLGARSHGSGAALALVRNRKRRQRMNRPLVNVEGLRVEFPSKRGAIAGVQDVSFTIEPGEIVCIVGESGSGKSVSAYTLMQLTKFSGGWVADGRLTLECGGGSEIDLRAADEARMRTIRGNEIGMIFQEPMTALNPSYTIGWQLAESLQQHRDMSREEAAGRSVELLKQVRIPNPVGG